MYRLGRAGFASLLVAASLAPSVAAGPSAPPPPAAAAPENAAARRYFSDVVLVDQHGRSQRLYSDLMRGKVLVVNSFYTSCTASCPVVMGTVARIQADLGDRVGSEVHILSLTVDPMIDTPGRLKEYAERLGARPGWYLLTGEKSNVEFALRRLGQWAPNKEAHLNLIVIGNDRTGLWKKAMALARPDDLSRVVEGVLADR